MDVTEQFLDELRDHILTLAREKGLSLEAAMSQATVDAERMIHVAWEMLDRELFPEQYPDGK